MTALLLAASLLGVGVTREGLPSASAQGAPRLGAGSKSAAGRYAVAAAVNVSAGDVAMPDSWQRCGSGVPTPCEASEKPAPEQPRNREGRPSVVSPIAIYTASASADYLSTRYALSHGSRERNPLMQSHASLVGLKAAQVGILTLVDIELQKRGHRGKALALRITAVVIGAGLAVHNVNVARRQK